jgi:hypothetical protein
MMSGWSSMRRSILAAFAMAGCIGKAAAHGSASPGPLADDDRDELTRRFAAYLSLVEKGDPRRLDYRLDRKAADMLDAELHGRRAKVRALALDEVAGWLGVELLIGPAGHEAAEARLFFLRLAEGYIAETVPVGGHARFIPGDGVAPLRPPAPDHAPLPESVRLSRMSARKFRDYLELFGRFDERFVEYYTPDIVFTASPAPAPLHGREAVLRLYRPLRANLGENLTVHHLVIDNQAGLMMAALTNRLTAFGQVDLPSRQMQAGDQLELSGAIVYGLQRGQISLIRDLGQ